MLVTADDVGYEPLSVYENGNLPGKEIALLCQCPGKLMGNYVTDRNPAPVDALKGLFLAGRKSFCVSVNLCYSLFTSRICVLYNIVLLLGFDKLF